MDRSDSRAPEDVIEALSVPHDAQVVWRILLNNPHTTTIEIGRLSGLGPDAVAAGIEALVEARLLRTSTAPAGATAIDPTLAIESHIARAERRFAEGIEQLAELRTHIPDLAKEYTRGRSSVEDQPRIEIISALEEIRRQVYFASEGCRSESRNIHHLTTTDGLRHGQPSDIALTNNGVRCRSIVKAADLNDRDFYRELDEAQRRGELYRTLPEVPTRMAIFDRKVAVVAVDPTEIRNGAMFIRVPSLVDLLVLLFDQMWAVADLVFAAAEDSMAPTGRCARTLELMAIGNKDERIARTLGVGARTIRRDLSDLKELLGVSSRAEIVAAAIRKGWL